MLNAYKPMNARKPLPYPFVRGAMLLCFFLSGATGLVYEVVWTRMLILVFGATTFAISTVLTAFMTGLALGGYAAGRWVDRRSRPVLIYGLLELGIGLYALAVPALFASLVPAYKFIWQHFGPQFYLFSLIRFMAVGGVLLVPTFLMGATLPVLGRFCVRTRQLIGTDVGTLYAVNTLGAVLGTLAGGFLLIPLAGVRCTILLAAGANLGIGLVAVVLGLRVGPAGVVEVSEHELPLEHDDAAPPRTVAAVLVAFALSGFAAMGYEVAWSRTLSLIIGSSVYAFTLMLATFLFGLAAGGMAAARLPARLAGRSATLIGVTQLLVAVSAYGVSRALGELPYLFTIGFKRFGQHGYGRLMAIELALAAGVMLVPTLLLGAMFPLAIRVCAPTVRRLGRSVGTVYAVNTIGAIVGSFCAGWALIPALGIVRTILVCVTANVAAAVLALWACRARWTLRAPLMAAGAGLAFSAWLQPPPWDPLVMSSGMYKYAADMEDGPISRDRFHSYVAGDYALLYYREGLTSTVTVARHKDTGNLWMATNGKIDASSGPDMPTQLLSGHLPMLLGRNPRDVLVVGFASGITVGAVATHPVTKVVTVEIEQAVIEGSRFFNAINRNPLADTRRVELVVDDARNYLLVCDRTFDAIISEPSNPWITGASNLFTKEYFELGNARLREGGIFVQWLQLYGMAEDDLRSLFATFTSVFEHVLVFETIESTDLVLMGSCEELQIDVHRVGTRLRRPEAADSLRAAGVDGTPRLLSYFLMGTSEVREFARGAPLNTDDNGLIEFSSPKHLHADTQTSNAEALAGFLRTVEPYLTRYGATPDARGRTLARIARSCQDRGLSDRASRLARVALDTSKAPAIVELLADIEIDASQPSSNERGAD